MIELLDARMFVRVWFQKNGIEINGAGFTKEKSGKDYGQIIDSMRLDYDASCLAMSQTAKIKPIAHTMLEVAARELVSETTIKLRQTALDRIKYNPELTDQALVNYLTCLLGTSPTEVDIRVIKQWIWQVKRKATGLSVVYHIMPIFFGMGQGQGKSKSIEILCEPLINYSIETTVADMSDSRYYFKYQEALIGFVNEMQGCARADMESVKRLLTASTIDVRRLGSNTYSKIKQNCSFFGTTNKHLSEMLVDSSMRRFYQYRIVEQFSHEIINSINYYEIWQSVDESLENGYTKDVLKNLQEVQKELSQEDFHEAFMKEFNLQAHQEGEYCFVTVSDTFLIYQQYCLDNGIKALSSNWMSVKFKSYGQKSIVKQDTNGKSTTYYKVSSQCTIKQSIPKGYNKVNGRSLEAM